MQVVRNMSGISDPIEKVIEAVFHYEVAFCVAREDLDKLCLRLNHRGQAYGWGTEYTALYELE